MLWVDCTVGQQRIAKPAHGGGHHIQLIINLPISVKFFILNNHRNIIDTPLFWQH
ncbi:Uncharacterised protein [Shigella sonnei]|nr:Uncharacterised protein [Shigella sonnei]